MDEKQAKEALDALRAEVTRRIATAANAGNSAEAQRLSQGYTSLDVLGRLLGVPDGGTGA